MPTIGAKFERLLFGDASDYPKEDGTPDLSRGDLALIGILSFYTLNDEQLIRLWRQSGLYRAKLERGDYVSRTIEMARGSQTASYTEGFQSADEEQERLFVLLMSVTGIRLGEALAFRWMDFDAKACTLLVNHTLYRQQLKEPKTKSSKATLKLAPSIAALLLSHKEQSVFQAHDDFIFCRPDGSTLNEPTLRNHLHAAMDKAEIKRVTRKYGFHIFRHSAGTLLYTKSRDLKLVQGTLRHADISVTSDIYVHLDDKVLTEGAEILTAEILTNCDLFVTQRSEMVS